ncbi:unnamed protein product, partial [Didymodactylos carnosus]
MLKGKQQCTDGVDEDHCEILEYNECDDKNEYRCSNGICIPQEYFLDGENDCPDASDEKYFVHSAHEIIEIKTIYCPIYSSRFDCDETIAHKSFFSCGDGQFLLEESRFSPTFEFLDEYRRLNCYNYRNINYFCELAAMWTLSNGHCLLNISLEKNPEDMTDDDEKCIFLLRLLLLRKQDELLTYWYEKLISDCQGPLIIDQKRIYYPRGHIITPYILTVYIIYNNGYFNDKKHVALYLIYNGTIKCRGYQAIANHQGALIYNFDYLIKDSLAEEFNFCTSKHVVRNETGPQYDEHCDSNKSFICQNIDRCISHYQYYQCTSGQCIPTDWLLNRIWDCSDASDEIEVHTVIKQSKHNTALQLDIRKKLQSFVIITSLSRFPYNICDHLNEYGCILANVQDPLNFTLNRPCITKSKIGDGQIDCYGGLDERNVLGCGNDINKQRGFDFHCHAEQCIPYKQQCREPCWNGGDKLLCDEIPNFKQHECRKIQSGYPLVAYNESRCDDGIDCKPFGLDQYYCDDSYNIPYRFHSWKKPSTTILHLPIYRSTIANNKKEWS